VGRSQPIPAGDGQISVVTNYRRRSQQRKRQIRLVTAWIMVIAIAVTGLGAVVAFTLR
jgi:hypothetical protein